MATEAQIAANRRNAEKSTGPRTPEGKRVTARNAVKHGAYSSLHSYTDSEANDLEVYFQHHFQTWGSPNDPEAHRLILEIALADYRRERTRGTLFRMMAHEQERTCDEVERYYGDEIEIGTRDAYVLRDDLTGPNLFTRLHKMENSFTRHMDKSTRELKARLASEQQAEPAQTAPEQPVEAELDETNPIHHRSAPCPCGSGEKYKRCCGKNAPPQLHSPHEKM